MKKKVIWLVVSCLMVAALVLAACAKPAAAPPKEEVAPPKKEEVAPPKKEVVTPPKKEEVAAPTAETVKLTLKKKDGTVVEKVVEKPKYGGEFRMWWYREPRVFDASLGFVYEATLQLYTNEPLLQGDWSMGPAGTGEMNWDSCVVAPFATIVGSVAESWEITGTDTIVYHIRKGVRFHNKPPTNGREVTADDVVFSLNREWDSGKSFQTGGARAINIESITASDKWTVVAKAKPGRWAYIWSGTTLNIPIVPRDAVEAAEKAGGTYNDWRLSVGTGPFMIKDYVTGSYARLERNPNYWMKDPLFPDNQLPYIDELRQVIIVDTSTRDAAMRTGKIDWIGGHVPDEFVYLESLESLLKANPNLKYNEYPGEIGSALYWRVDKPELPWYDVRVRRALALAVNREEIAKTYYRGKAIIYDWPITGLAKEVADGFVPWEQLTAEAKMVFQYDLEKSKALMKEAGYPNGFKAQVITPLGAFVELAEMVKGYWAKIGVDLEIQPKEYGSVAMLLIQKQHPQMMMWMTATNIMGFSHTLAGGGYNASNINLPAIQNAYAQMQANYFDRAKYVEAFKSATIPSLEQAVGVFFPQPLVYTVWQPWVKNYHGESSVGFIGSFRNYPKYIWIDQDLREKMTGAR